MIPAVSNRDKAQLKRHAVNLLKQRNYEGLIILIEELKDTDFKFPARINKIEVLNWAFLNLRIGILKVLHEKFAFEPEISGFVNTQASKNNLLFLAVCEGDLAAVKYFQSIGADILSIHFGVLKEAYRKGHLEVLSYLANNNVPMFADNKDVIKHVIETGNVDLMQLLIAQGADIHAHDNYAICHASKMGKLSIVNYLVELGANIKDSINPLRLAALNKHKEVVHYLATHGADVDKGIEDALTGDYIREVLKNDSSNK